MPGRAPLLLALLLAAGCGEGSPLSGDAPEPERTVVCYGGSYEPLGEGTVVPDPPC